VYPTVGHTHNSVDAHFGALESILKKRILLTPQGQICVIRPFLISTSHADQQREFNTIGNTTTTTNVAPFELRSKMEELVRTPEGRFASHYMEMRRNAQTGGPIL